MTDLRQAATLALEALEHLHRTGNTQVFDLCYAPELIPALRTALEQPEQRTWVGLKVEDWEWVADRKGTSLDSFDQGVVWAQARLKERNT